MKSQVVLPGNAGHHAVHFYGDDTRLCMSVADFLADGIAARQPIVVIATPEHRHTLVEALTARRFDIANLIEEGRCALLDARETLDLFMIEGMPDPALFRQVVGVALERVSASDSGMPVRAYGEMVDVLWRAGNSEGAIKLELLWNELAHTHAFSLLCGYAMGSFFKETGRDAVCALHTHVHS
jgi:MEDS: MEthanogen/methylotroph, DcmR Sensory domain